MHEEIFLNYNISINWPYPQPTNVFHHDNLTLFICVCGIDIVYLYSFISVERSLDMIFIKRGLKGKKKTHNFYYY
jgi:hypothetical protein